MFTDLDEYPTHQIVAPHGTVSVDSPAWTDRYYFSCFRPDGSVVLHMGVGVFPNLRLVEAWSCSVVHEKGRYFQINVRPSASYDGSPWPLRAGPLSFALGAGPVITFPRTRVRGEKLQSDQGFWGGYFLSGGHVMASATRSFPVAVGVFLSLDARASASYVRIPVAHGHASVPNVALHLHAGLGYGFGRSERPRD